MPNATSLCSLRRRKKKEQPYIIPPEALQRQAESTVTSHNDTATESTIPQRIPEESAEINTPETNTIQEPITVTTTTVTTPEPSVVETPETTTTPTLTTPDIKPAEHRVSGLSLKSLKKKKEIQEKLEGQQPDIANLPKDTFTEEELLIAWKSYIQKLTHNGEKIMASMLESGLPALEGSTVLLEYPNETMKVEVTQAQGHLLQHLRKALNNYDISLSITVNEEKKDHTPYLPKEKYAYLKEKNPDIDLLKKTFDLEIPEA